MLQLEGSNSLNTGGKDHLFCSQDISFPGLYVPGTPLPQYYDIFHFFQKDQELLWQQCIVVVVLLIVVVVVVQLVFLKSVIIKKTDYMLILWSCCFHLDVLESFHYLKIAILLSNM